MKIKGQQPAVQHATPQSMKKIVKEQEAIFQRKLDNVDPSKTKTHYGKYETIITYYDKNGNELYSRSELPDANGKDVAITYIYSYDNGDGTRVRFLDDDRDGNMDRMDYESNKNGTYTAFQAFDENDDGTFDEGMPNTGRNAGHHFDIKN